MKSRVAKYFDAARATSVPAGKSGNWSVEHFTITKQQARNYSMMAMFSASYGSGRGRITEGDYVKLSRGSLTIMSDSPDELNDMWPLYDRLLDNSPRRVLINGLGLGCALRAVLACETVEHVDVVELSEDVLHLIPVTDPRVTIINDNAFTWQFPKSDRWDIAWHDVWDELSTDDLSNKTRPGESHETLSRRYAPRVAWQYCWGHEYLLYTRRRERSSGW